MLPDAIDQRALRRVLVTKLRHHGDVLLASPVVSVLKRQLPDAEVDALVYAETSPMLQHHPDLSVLHTIDRNWKNSGVGRQVAEEVRLVRALAARRYDLLVHLTEHPRGAWLAQLLRTRYAVAPRRPAEDLLWRHSFTHYYLAPRATPRHTVEFNLDALRRVGIYPAEETKRLVLYPGAAAERAIEERLRAHALAPGGFVVLHPGSRWQFKCWPAEKSAALIDALHAQNMIVIMTGAPDEHERHLATEILVRVQRRPLSLVGELSLLELAALIARARLFVGVDSAPMHMAAAAGVPVVALFGPSGEAHWGPWMVPHRVVASALHPCRPCGNDGCGGGKISECLTTLPVQQLLAAIASLLAETSAGTPSSSAPG